MKILLLDNYDSFTYNLLHAVKELGATDVEVVRNDQINLDKVERFNKIILSPGPGIPEEAGLLLPIIKRYAPTKSILGVCLGHQPLRVQHRLQRLGELRPRQALRRIPGRRRRLGHHAGAIHEGRKVARPPQAARIVRSGG